MKPLFSIVIPVYNTVKELGRCVTSITTQSFLDYELVLVDDGSTDGSGKLCDALAEKNDKIQVIHKENGGASEARNTGVRATSGEYLLFVDSDDMWDDPNALANIAQIVADSQQPDAVCFGVSIYNEEGKLVKIRKPILPDRPLKTKEELLRHLVYTNQYFSAPYVKALRRDFFVENNLFFVKGLLSEDIEWSARIMIHSREMAIYSSAFYKRIRREEGSLTSAIDEKNVLAILTSIEKGVVYAKQNAENDALLELYYEYWAYQYAMLLGLSAVAQKEQDWADIATRLKKLSWLLRYDHVKKVKWVRRCYKTLGFHNTVRLLSMYYKRRR